MTCVVAVRDPKAKRFWLASDRLVDAEGTRVLVHSKWVEGRQYALGVAGQYDWLLVAAQVLGEVDAGPKRPPGPRQLLATLRERCLEAANAYETPGGPHALDFGGVLVSATGRLWYVSSTFCPLELADFAAVGSGRDLALGAITALRALGRDYGSEIPAEYQCRSAIGAASALQSECSGTWAAEYNFR